MFKISILLANLLLCYFVTAANQYKNVLFIVVDDLGWADLGYDNEEVHTPNIDRLALTGIRLNSSYTYPVCTPTRTSFLTGVFAERTGLQNAVILPLQPRGIPSTFTLLPKIFKGFGYTSHAIGKWHLGFCNMNYTPVNQGFDTFYGISSAQADHYTRRSDVPKILNGLDFLNQAAEYLKPASSGQADHYTRRLDLPLGREGLKGLDFWNQTADYLKPVYDRNNEYSLNVYTDRAIEIFENTEKDKPFFMYFATQSVHTPLQVPESYEERYKHIKDKNRRTYLGMVSALDESVGNLTSALKRLGKLDDTLIIFTSDNGGSLNAGAVNSPLRGGKLSVFEGGTRVKAFVNGKGLNPSVYNGMFHAVDWMPTMLHAAIGRSVEINGIDGVDQWPSLTNNLPSLRNSFIHNIDPLGTIGLGLNPIEAISDWKLIKGFYPGGIPPIFVPYFKVPKFLNNSTKELINAVGSGGFLFNIKGDVDPLEKKNLLLKHPDIVAKLNAKIDDYKKITVNPQTNRFILKGNPKYFDNTWSPGWC